MSLYQTVFELIDMRSFSNLWFWIALAVMWALASHHVLGVPWDMVAHAAREGGDRERDLDVLVRIRAARLLRLSRVAGLWLVAAVSLILTALAILGFWYGVEFAQAVFLLALPMTVVRWLGFATARRIAAGGLRGAALRRRLSRHRHAVQTIGIVSIFVTALWGMYQNLAVGPLGG